MFATSHPYTLCDPYMFRTGDPYPTDYLPVISTTDSCPTDRSTMIRTLRIIIVCGRSDVSGAEVPPRQTFSYRWAKICYGWGKVLPFGVLWLLWGTLSYREAATSFSEEGIVRYGLFLHVWATNPYPTDHWANDP